MKVSRTTGSVLILLALLVVHLEAADFDFTIKAVFKNTRPTNPSFPYFDYCGFDCSGANTDYRMLFLDDYCDAACRQFNGNLWGPMCYRNNRCPATFNSAFQSAVQVRWGSPAGSSGMSGMGFNPINGGRGSFNVQQEFKLGDLTHYNFPIAANTAITAFDFIFTLSITRGGTTFLPPTDFEFKLNCDETPNNLIPAPCANPTCPYPSRLSCGSTPPGCPDQISFVDRVSRTAAKTFTLTDGAKYTLAITGFRLPGDRSTLPTFISDEKMFTTAELFAVVTRACPDCPENKKPIFDQKTFTCRCECEDKPCPNGQVRQPDCTCACPSDACGLGAVAVLKDGKCTCDCSTGDASKCIKPKIPGFCADKSKCCCNCPDNKCPSPSTPDPNTENCACTNCPPCTPKGPNYVPSADNCTCICPLSQKNCKPLLETFNPTKCGCDCKFSCTEDFVADNCNCVCSKSKLDAKCQALNRVSLYVPFDPNNPNAAKCSCGDCVGQFTNNPQSNVCECKINCTNQFVLDKANCVCKCPPAGPTCNPPLVPDLPNCQCVPCKTGNCECPPERKITCDTLKRQYIFNSTFCGCTDCIGAFIDSDPQKKQAVCDNCPLTDAKCKADSNSLKILNATSCECVCPPNPKCPNPRDIYVPETCSCRPCLPGECVCGNGYVEAGELCDSGANATECCKDCLLLNDVSCNLNKCGKCVRNGNDSKCVDISKDLCKSDECYESVCATDGGQQVCKVTNFDGKACGDGDLCARRCVEGRCVDYDLARISTLCATPPPECGACCSFACNRSTGNCSVSWAPVNQTCSDGSVCTVNDTCVPNTGNTTVPLKCVGTPKCTEAALGKTFGSPCTNWACSTETFGTCIEVPAGTNVTCPATGFCSLAGNCSINGECVQPRRQCVSSDPCKVGRCREDLVACEFVKDLANGLPCDDGNNCTAGDVCVDGACKGNDACNTTTPGPTIPLIPLVVTAAVVAAAALVAGFFIYQAIQGANIMDPVSWGEVNSSQFDANPLYQEATKFGDNPLYQS